MRAKREGIEKGYGNQGVKVERSNKRANAGYGATNEGRRMEDNRSIESNRILEMEWANRNNELMRRGKEGHDPRLDR